MARSSTTTDVFNAVAEARRREILDTLIAGEKAVGAIVDDLSMSQPQVSKHLRVLSEVGLVSCRAQGRRRLYRLEPAHLRPLHDWMAKYEQAWNDRLDRMDDYLKELQQKGEPQGPPIGMDPQSSSSRASSRSSPLENSTLRSSSSSTCSRSRSMCATGSLHFRVW